MTQTFKPGDKVEIITGGWGIHPRHVGKTGTIHSQLRNGRYTLEETLIASGESAFDFTTHTAKVSSAEACSFRLIVPQKTTMEQIEALNEKIRDVNASIDRVNTSLISENARRNALARQREELVQKLLQELQP